MKFPSFLRHFFIASIYVTERVKKSLEFVYILTDLLIGEYSIHFSIIKDLLRTIYHFIVFIVQFELYVKAVLVNVAAKLIFRIPHFISITSQPFPIIFYFCTFAGINKYLYTTLF
jgi:hypothetical protein